MNQRCSLTPGEASKCFRAQGIGGPSKHSQTLSYCSGYEQHLQWGKKDKWKKNKSRRGKAKEREWLVEQIIMIKYKDQWLTSLAFCKCKYGWETLEWSNFY